MGQDFVVAGACVDISNEILKAFLDLSLHVSDDLLVVALDENSLQDVESKRVLDQDF